MSKQTVRKINRARKPKRATSQAAQKKIVIIAVPNGAGKTTFAEEFLRKEAGCEIFINADLIARASEDN